jgi:Rhodopirellula transposase.
MCFFSPRRKVRKGLEFQFFATWRPLRETKNRQLLRYSLELIGNYRQNARVWRPKGEPELVKVYDFIDKKLGKAMPYGIYDLQKNVGWVNVGIDHDTAEFAVESIRRW